MELGIRKFKIASSADKTFFLKKMGKDVTPLGRGRGRGRRKTRID